MFDNRRTFDAAAFMEHLLKKKRATDMRKRKRGEPASTLVEVESHRPSNRSGEPTTRRFASPKAQIPPSDAARAQASNGMLLGTNLNPPSSPPPPYSRRPLGRTPREHDHEIDHEVPISTRPSTQNRDNEQTDTNVAPCTNCHGQWVASLWSNTSLDDRQGSNSVDVNIMVQTRLQKRARAAVGQTTGDSSSRRGQTHIEPAIGGADVEAEDEDEGEDQGNAVAASDEACVRNPPVASPSHTKRRATQLPRGGKSLSEPCAFCQRARADILECQDCANRIRLCIDCRRLHPGHTFKEAQARPVSPVSHQGRCHKSKHTYQQPTSCHICRKQLSSSRFECQDCPGKVTFCPHCYELHPPQHKLKVVRCPPDSGEGVAAEEGDEEDVINAGQGDNSSTSDNANRDDDSQGELDEHVSDGATGWADEFDKNGHGGSDRPREQVGQAGHVRNVNTSANEDKTHPRPPRGKSKSTLVHRQPDVTPLPPAGQLRRPRQPPQVTVTFSRQRLLEFAEMAEAVAATARKLLSRPQESPERVQELIADGLDQNGDDNSHAASLLDFDSDAAAFDDAAFDDSAFDDDQHLETRQRSSQTREEAGLSRQWLPHEKQRLRELKGRGVTHKRIAEMLNRTPSAVSQQWKKQKDLAV